MRKVAILTVDLGCVALTAILAVLIRDNFVPYVSHLESATVYATIAAATSSLVFIIAGLDKRLWQYTSLTDVFRIMTAVTVALLIALFAGFVLNRLEGIARSMPVIHWFLLVSAMVGTRVGFRLWCERKRRDRFVTAQASIQHVLVIGLSHLTELYLQSVAEYASEKIDVVGILSEQREVRGRSLRFQKVLGTPEELLQVINQLEVHGVTLERIVVMQPAEELSREGREAVLTVEKNSCIEVEWLVERLGLIGTRDDGRLAPPLSNPDAMHHALGVAGEVKQLAMEAVSRSGYLYVKRVSDILGVISLSTLLAPLILVIAVLVALDVGLPIVFWQKRPGRFGRPFKLFKFCTMRPAHDAQGNRIPDEERSSTIGRFLRRTRLDELPQLYNVLIGEMSFVGPRPLLPVDQPVEGNVRLFVKPGLTGLAQVHGGRDIVPNDKNALDIWYVRNASLWLDIKILLRTPIFMMRGDHYNLRGARAGLERLKVQIAASSDAHPIISKGVGGEGRVKIAHPLI